MRLMSTLRKRSPVGGDNRYKETTHADIMKRHERQRRNITHDSKRPRLCVCSCEPTMSASEETRQYRYCDFCDDQGSWSQAMIIAASLEPAVKINAAKPPRKSWLAAMTIGLGLHGPWCTCTGVNYPKILCPSFSTPVVFVRQFPVLHFPVVQFQSPPCNLYRVGQKSEPQML